MCIASLTNATLWCWRQCVRVHPDRGGCAFERVLLSLSPTCPNTQSTQPPVARTHQNRRIRSSQHTSAHSTSPHPSYTPTHKRQHLCPGPRLRVVRKSRGHERSQPAGRIGQLLRSPIWSPSLTLAWHRHAAEQPHGGRIGGRSRREQQVRLPPTAAAADLAAVRKARGWMPESCSIGCRVHCLLRGPERPHNAPTLRTHQHPSLFSRTFVSLSHPQADDAAAAAPPPLSEH